MSIVDRIKRGEPPPEAKKPKYFPWDQSATGQWSDEEMAWLRDAHPEEVAEALWEPGRGVQGYALFEFVAHGNFQKAALVARALERQHPICGQSIRKDVGPEMSKILFETEILKLSTKPQ